MSYRNDTKKALCGNSIVVQLCFKETDETNELNRDDTVDSMSQIEGCVRICSIGNRSLQHEHFPSCMQLSCASPLAEQTRRPSLFLLLWVSPSICHRGAHTIENFKSVATVVAQDSSTRTSGQLVCNVGHFFFRYRSCSPAMKPLATFHNDE